MRISQILTERATDIVYHYTSQMAADQILKSGVFKLASSMGSSVERKYSLPGYPYFFSTSRSKVGDYHRYVGSGGVMFVLDGQWLSARYPVRPIDYWERSWAHAPDRTSESEDRVYSKEPTISIDCVTAIHVLIKDQHDFRSPKTRTILINAKKRGIKTYLYTDEDAWRLQDTRKIVTPGQIKDILKGTEPKGYMQRPIRGVGKSNYGRSSILNWIELLKKQPGQELSKEADKLRYNLTYYSDQWKSLEADLHNARKPDSNEYDIANKLTNFMVKNNLSLQSLQDYIKKKWSEKR